MSDPVVEAARKILDAGAEKARTARENNELIKNRLVSELNGILKYLEDLRDGETVTGDAKTFLVSKKTEWGNVFNQAKAAVNNFLIFVMSIDIDKYNISYMDAINLPLEIIKKNYDIDTVNLIPSDLYECISLIRASRNYIETYKIDNDRFNSVINSSITKMLDEAKQELNSFRRIKNLVDNARTENIYDQAVVKYRGLETDYRIYFYWALALTVGISLGTFFLKKVLVPDLIGNVEFWVLKASIILVGLTLITYFLKQSAHYQRLADQNYQTQIELQAYPSFMESIPTEEAASVRKELALKYFGREIDGAAHKDMSNLISDQMKSTTEMVKAATDVLKAKG